VIRRPTHKFLASRLSLPATASQERKDTGVKPRILVVADDPLYTEAATAIFAQAAAS
jgi:hypothetical protein